MTSNKAQIDLYVNGIIYDFLCFFNSHISGPLSSKAFGDMKNGQNRGCILKESKIISDMKINSM